MKDITTLQKRADVGIWLNENGLTGQGVEIGVQNGINADQILTHWKGFLWLVDPWRKQPSENYKDGTNDIDFDAALNDTNRRMEKFMGRYAIARVLSDDAIKLFNNPKMFDFVYIDGNHSMPQCGRDIEQWWNLLKDGGLIGGHDYLTLDTTEWKCDVEQAVNDFVKAHGLKLHVTQDESTAEVGGWPSWWIVKQ